MKETPQEKERLRNFQAGTLTKEGFLGEDNRHIHDIVEDDRRTLAPLGWTQEAIADFMQGWIQTGKKSLEGEMNVGELTLRCQWDRGMGPCPFGEPGLYPKIVIWVRHPKSELSLRFSQLSVHLIRKHGFFGGRGSAFRVNPETVIQLIQTLEESNT